MSQKPNDGVTPRRPTKKVEPVVTRGKTTVRGEEWIVLRNGAAKTIITSPSSAQAMDSTSVVYVDSLKRLAKK